MRVDNYRLAELVKLDSGFAFKSDLFNEKEGLPIIRIRDVSVGWSKTRYKGEYDKRYIVSNGDYLITMDGEFKINEWTGGLALLNQRVCRVSVVSSGLEQRYLYYFLPAELKKIEDRTPFVTVKHLSVSDINKIEIPLPPLETQKKIADVLDKAQELIDKRKEQIEKLDEFTQSVFLDMFETNGCRQIWDEGKLIDYCADANDIKCGPFGTQLKKEEYVKQGIPLWGIPQIHSCFMIKPKEYLTPAKASELKAYSIEPGDIVMSRKGNVGKCALYPIDLESGVMHSDVLRIRVNKSRINPVFLCHQLHFSIDIQRQIEVVSSGAIMAGVNVGKLKSIIIRIPPLELQSEFAKVVAQAEKQKDLMQKSLAAMETNFNSIMQRAFRGELL